MDYKKHVYTLHFMSMINKLYDVYLIVCRNWKLFLKHFWIHKIVFKEWKIKLQKIKQPEKKNQIMSKINNI